MAQDGKKMPIGFSHLDISGRKIRLRPTRTADTEAAYNLITNEAILSNLAWDGPANEDELLNSYRRWEKEIKTGENYSRTIERLDQPGAIGCINIRFPKHPQQADIGYWLGVPFWNQGYMTEAIRLACHLTFKHLDTVRVYTTVFAGNLGSRWVLEKNGFSLDGTMRCHVNKRGRWRDAWFFTLLRTEWEHNYKTYCPNHEEIVAKR